MNARCNSATVFAKLRIVTPLVFDADLELLVARRAAVLEQRHQGIALIGRGVWFIAPPALPWLGRPAGGPAGAPVG